MVEGEWGESEVDGTEKIDTAEAVSVTTAKVDGSEKIDTAEAISVTTAKVDGTEKIDTADCDNIRNKHSYTVDYDRGLKGQHIS